MKRRLWTREELILAFNLYLKLPFGKMHSSNSQVIYLARLINRTPSSIAMRLTNFASVDPYHQKRGVSGLPGGRKQVEPIWNEYVNNRANLIFESENILAQIEQKSLETKYKDLLVEASRLKGETKLREVKTRVNQSVFRQIVLANYNNKCAVTGIDLRDLLVASHIVPWALNEKERLNPENGICFSALYDKAFDKGLIGINSKYEIILSSNLKKNENKNYFNLFFNKINGQKLNLPSKYLPRKEFLDYHLEVVFKV